MQDNLPPNDNLVEAIDVLDSRFEKRDAADLKSDIRINSLLAENARRGGLFMIPPDVELLDYDQSIDNYQRQEIVDPYENQQIIRQNFNVT